MIEKEQKQKIAEKLKVARENFTGSDARFAISLGINNAQYSRVKNGQTEKVLSEQNWISLARRLDVDLFSNRIWNTARTPVYQFISKQLEMCQENGISSLLCDLSDIGKTYTAELYSKTHKNAVYIDCSQVKSKQRLIRFVAKSFGVGATGRYVDVYEDLVFFLRTLSNPLIIFDEFGDLNSDAVLECKALWNGARNCAFYVMGADGLENRMRRSIDNKKVGYSELFSRFGKRYGKVVPIPVDDRKRVLQSTAMMIIKANSDGKDSMKIFRGTLGDDGRPSLRRIYNELSKIN